MVKVMVFTMMVASEHGSSGESFLIFWLQISTSHPL